MKGRLALACCVVFLCIGTRAQELSDFSLEQLLQVSVTTASRHEKKLSDTAAAIYVITQDEIRRSAATSIPELLRMVPGLQVARIAGNQWAISSRGLASLWSDKMLVLVDGRSIYDQTNGGVSWSMIDVTLEDVDRIEVIRGPGASVWGSNAVNGVINIITRSAHDTQGVMLTATAGNVERGASAVRYGGKLGANTYYRVYSKYFDRGNSLMPDGSEAFDHWDQFRGGLRMETILSPRDSLTVEGEWFRGTAQNMWANLSYAPPALVSPVIDTSLSGMYTLASWTRKLQNGSEMNLKFYYNDRANGDWHNAQDTKTFDLDFQYGLVNTSRHAVLVGGGYREMIDKSERRGGPLWYDHPETNEHLRNVFVQDEISFAQNRFTLTLGTKLEDNSYTGVELEPTVRGLWKVTPSHSVWAAVSRAARLPTKFDVSGNVDLSISPTGDGLFVVPRLVGNRSLGSESVIAYEAGHRWQARKNLLFDTTVFLDHYTSLVDFLPAAPFVEPNGPLVQLVLPLRAQNAISGNTWGAEMLSMWSPSTRFRISGHYAFLRLALRSNTELASSLPASLNEGSPRHQLYLQPSFNLTRNLAMDWTARAVGPLPGDSVPGYGNLDVKLRWQASETAEFSFAIQNLLDRNKEEFARPDGVGITLPKRNLYAKLVWRL